jgi:hypothetical protein
MTLHFELVLRYRENAQREIRAKRQQIARSLDEEAAAFFADEPTDVRDTALRFLSATETAA